MLIVNGPQSNNNEFHSYHNLFTGFHQIIVNRIFSKLLGLMMDIF